MIYADLESILVPEDNVKKNPDESYRHQKNIKNMLLSVMVIDQYVLMINLVNLLSHMYVKILLKV